MSEVYRRAVPEDSEKVLKVILGAYKSIRELGIEFHAVHADIEMIRNNVIQNNCYVLEQNGAIVATISHKPLQEVTPYPFLYWFAVDPLVSSKGVGSKLLRYVEEAILRDALQASAVTLATSRKHPWLLPMYERKGYKPFYERALGKDDQLVFLTKILVPDAIPEQVSIPVQNQ
ncbi:GNAT family N-acetyltransferase [Paenibacillus rigui]|uniref:GNAT family N-acetyltransferase n=1 Tax=Paenibacillus rigui TaxID=554312 RepID=A0A229US41_9BACL|nr:GNAT family N-acetyltransferase [Paenibacillus rigui]OXM86212.1 GNAT family N-acetyltransferase [Paenibacillus rigui]